MSEDALEAAQRAYQSAQEALHTARRKLAEAVLDAYTNGEPIRRIAERTGQSTTNIWNTLAVHGITPRSRINGST
ncbi:helix-turn-helix domain-containing protein [[Kitasatospora] papulosa]|uniref:helix-turn-helix domain-containing protein n=1 Tax=[Kitasatospora] papulosa TaxID=1464011 RepID=UPI00367A36FF